jgi:adenylate cyclase
MKEQFIICVDDEQIVLNSLNKQLKRRFGKHYEYEFAESAEEAIELIEELLEDGHEVAMIITDQIMPGLTGVEFLAFVHEKHPTPMKVLLTGQATLDAAVAAINETGLYRFLNKPWEEEDLLLTIEKGLKEYSLLQTLKNQMETFRKFVPEQFLECLGIKSFETIESSNAIDIELSIMFIDIRGFSRMSEAMTGAETFKFLNTFYKRMDPPITDHGGFIDKFMGDGIMALFHKTTSDAVDAGIAIFKELEKFNNSKNSDVHFPVDIGIGINTGKCALGIVGSGHRNDSTVVGDTVNIASRIEGMNKHFGSHFLISEATYNKLSNPENYSTRFIGNCQVRGKSQHVNLYEIFDMDPTESKDLKLEDKESFERAIQLLQSGKKLEAKSIFEACIAKNPEDSIAEVYLNQCDYPRSNN